MSPVRQTTEVVVEAPQTRSQLDKEFPLRFKEGDTTPTVQNLSRFIANPDTPVTITQFDNGADGQVIWILGDGVTNVANNANIIRQSTGFLVLNAIYVFVRIVDPTTKVGVWYELTAGPLGGGGASPSVGIVITDFAMTPTLIAAGETFLVPADKQALWAVPIVVDGTLDIEGSLVQVD